MTEMAGYGPCPATEPHSDTPLVIAHRGSSSAEPEHTLAAYMRAIDEGADGLECDVRLTADSHLVCVHDRRMNRTSNGRGIVSTLELAELEGLDWGRGRPCTVATRRCRTATATTC